MMVIPRRILNVAVGASVTVFLMSCGEATESVDRTDEDQSNGQVTGKADSFEELERLDRDGTCDESDAQNDP
ncbi:MAG: hypothetical protein ABEN55_14295, partial [Bradymonadaceae bacterium]